MSRVFALYVWTLRRDRGILVILAWALFVLEALIVWIARALDTGGAFATLAGLIPEFVRRSAGFDVALVLSFSGTVGIGYFHPATMAVLIAAAILVARGPVTEVEGRTIDLIVARPVPRRAVVVRSLAMTVTAAVLLPGAMLAGTVTGLALVGRLGHVAFGPFLSLALDDAILLAGFASVFVLFSSVSRRTRAFVQASVGLAVASYLLDFLARVWQPIRPLGPLSLFHYADPGLALAGHPGLVGPVVVAAVALAASSLALIAFDRRDL